MVSKVIQWSVSNPLIVLLMTVALAGAGVYAFCHVNVEAYPDPAPAILEVIALYPGKSAEEIFVDAAKDILGLHTFLVHGDSADEVDELAEHDLIEGGAVVILR